MAIKSIDDLTAPVGMTEKENQKGLKITVPLEATNQDREGMDFLANPLMTPTDIDPAYNINEPAPLDYADRFDFEKKTKKPSLINRAIRTGIMLAGPGKFVRGANLLMNAPEIIGGIFKSGKKIKPTNLDDIIEDIGEEKLKTFSKQTDLVKYIKEEYGVDIGKTLISKRIKKGQFSIGDRTKVNEEFVELFENNPELIDRIGKNKAKDHISLSYDERFLRRKKLVSDNGFEFLVNLPETKSLSENQAFRLQSGNLILIKNKKESLLEIKGKNLMQLIWHIGNRHMPCQIEKDRIFIQYDEVIKKMILKYKKKL